MCRSRNGPAHCRLFCEKRKSKIIIFSFLSSLSLSIMLQMLKKSISVFSCRLQPFLFFCWSSRLKRRKKEGRHGWRNCFLIYSFFRAVEAEPSRDTKIIKNTFSLLETQLIFRNTVSNQIRSITGEDISGYTAYIVSKMQITSFPRPVK